MISQGIITSFGCKFMKAMIKSPPNSLILFKSNNFY